MDATSPPALRALKCPSCASALRAEDLDAARGFVKCSYCQALMTLPAAQPAEPGFRARGEVPLPPGIALEETAGGIEIRRRWFTPAFIFLAFFCVAWDGFLVFWYSVVFATGAPWIMAVFPLVHLAAGVGLTYSTLAGFLNTTRIRVERGQLSVVHGPLPWLGNRTIDAEAIAQLFCKERVHRGKRGSQSTYEVWVALADGRSAKLTAAGNEPDAALYLEQQIERALGLKDRPVAGELAR